MSSSETDGPMLRLQLMIARQERDDSNKERDKFKQFYLIISQNLVSRSRG